MGLLGEVMGKAVGALWGPPFRAIAERRHARSLHAEGICLRAEVIPLLAGPTLLSVGQRLAGPALVRLSTSMWRNGKEWPDILGAAVRFLRQNHITEDAMPGDQDLLFSTMRHMWTIAPAVLSTRVHDFLENDYHGIAPFRVDGVGRVKLRLTSPRDVAPRQGSRVERLQEAMSTGTAVLTFEARSLDSGAPHTWRPLAEIFLREEVTLDPERLRFSPFRDGLGITPIGFLHHMRRSAYQQSQVGRTEH
ncbi:hypothetical protein F0U62_44685 [Cystobacter fuscus]|nr:hypothetical protein F0U62_44685 [Cystobacter fuscus]